MESHTSAGATSSVAESLSSLHRALLRAWNRRDARSFAALFEESGCAIGFDGSQMIGSGQIAASLTQIFADHATARYVARIREVRSLARDVAMVHAVAGMVPPGQSDINPAVNAVQTMVAVEREGGWCIAVFQSTPAAYHGRPEASDSLTEELREELRAHGVDSAEID